jgi:eukaryotic-like serine/threonine-protein kinase
MSEPAVSVAGSRESQLSRAVDEFMVEVRLANHPDVEAFAAKHPEIAEELRRVLPALAMLRTSEPLSNFADPDLESGTLGDFRLIREVGRGGMGIVYEAEQISLCRRVALKVLPFAATMDPRQLQRFRNEAQAAACLHHPNIVPVHGVGVERGVHYYAMQLIEGQTLAEVIHSLKTSGLEDSAGATIRRPSGPPEFSSPEGDGAVAPGEALRTRGSETRPNALLTTKPDGKKGREFFRSVAALIADAADALEYAHSMGVLHRDIKPGNLMLDNGGGLWITDFGLAKALSPGRQPADGQPGDLTLTGDMIGTLRYMSPEAALAKHGLVDHRTDIYSLGATLYELLTLKPAVDGADKGEMLNRIAWDEPIALRKLDKSIPAELETVTLKCLAKEPGDRYATAGEMAADLRRWLEEKPIRAKPPGWRERTAKWGRRHRGILISVAAVLGLAVLGLGGLTALLFNQKVETENALGQARANLDLAAKQRQRAWQAVDDMYTQVAEKWLVGEPGKTELQREFLDKALRFYEDLANEVGDTPDLLKERVKAAKRLAIILGDVGRPGEAETAFRRAIALLEMNDVPDKAPGLAIVYDDLAVFLNSQGRQLDATLANQRALEIWETVPAEVAAREAYRDGRATALLNRCTALVHLRRYSECEPVFRQSTEILRGLIADFPGNARYRASLGAVLTSYAAAVCNLGDPIRSCTLIEEAIRHTEEATRLDPRESEFRRLLQDQYLVLADRPLRMLNRIPEAVAAARKSLAVAQKLVVDFPAMPDYRRNEAACFQTLGDTLSRAEDFVGAEDAYRESVMITDRLLAADPASKANRVFAGRPRIQLGRLCCVNRRNLEALDYFRHGFAFFEADSSELTGCRTDAAAAAVRASEGVGPGADKLDAGQQAELRRQALDWLSADRAALIKAAEMDRGRAKLRKELEKWQKADALAGVRGADALAKLPEAERAAWQKLWADVAELQKRTEEPAAPTKPSP